MRGKPENGMTDGAVNALPKTDFFEIADSNQPGNSRPLCHQGFKLSSMRSAYFLISRGLADQTGIMSFALAESEEDGKRTESLTEPKDKANNALSKANKSFNRHRFSL